MSATLTQNCNSDLGESHHKIGSSIAVLEVRVFAFCFAFFKLCILVSFYLCPALSQSISTNKTKTVSILKFSQILKTF